MPRKQSESANAYQNLKDQIYKVAANLAAEFEALGLDPEFAGALARFSSTRNGVAERLELTTGIGNTVRPV